MNTITTTKKVTDLLDNIGDCPMPLDVMPNRMGINLCSVDSISWQRQDDGQLTHVEIAFIPKND